MKKNFKNKTIALLLSCTMVLSAIPTTVFAESTNVNSTGSVETDFGTDATDSVVGQDQNQLDVDETTAISKDQDFNQEDGDRLNTDENDDAVVNVFATIASTYTVRIPKTIILSGTNGIGIYKVEVQGDIAANEDIYIMPDDEFQLESGQGKESITATVKQITETWNYDDIISLSDTTGTITAADIEAGTWNGSFNFTIGIKPSGQYAMLSGDKVYNKSEDTGVMTFKSSADFSIFDNVKIDGEIIDSSNYTATKGSTIIELNESYVKNLKFGYHTIEIVSNDESAEAEFEITQNIYMDDWARSDYVPWVDYSSTLTSYKFVEYEEIPETAVESWDITDTANYNTDEKSLVAWVSEDGKQLIISSMGDLKSIGEYAFGNCTELACNLTIPSSVTSIGSNAFTKCSKLTGELTIPSGVTSINGGTFNGCSGLTGALTIPSGVTSVGGGAFNGCTGLTGKLTMPEGLVSIGSYTFYNCNGLTENLTIPSSVTSIGERAFNGCSGLTGDLIIPSGITSIEVYAFAYCSGLDNVTIPKGVTSIGGYAFYDCDGLTNITIPEGVTSIGSGTFAYCNGLSSVNMSEGVISIGESAFYDCGGLIGTLKIPSTVTSIGRHAFSRCNKLTSITIPDSVATINSGAFSNVPEIIYSGSAAGSPWGAQLHTHTHTYTELVEATCQNGSTYDGICIVNGCDYQMDEFTTDPIDHKYVQLVEAVTNTSNGNYAFIQDGTKWTSNNNGVSSSTATSTWTITVDEAMSYEFKYKVSSQASYDKLTITVNGTTIVNGISGAGSEMKYTIQLSAGENTIVATYTKNTSTDSNDDQAYLRLPQLEVDADTCLWCGTAKIE